MPPRTAYQNSIKQQNQASGKELKHKISFSELLLTSWIQNGQLFLPMNRNQTNIWNTLICDFFCSSFYFDSALFLENTDFFENKLSFVVQNVLKFSIWVYLIVPWDNIKNIHFCKEIFVCLILYLSKKKCLHSKP